MSGRARDVGTAAALKPRVSPRPLPELSDIGDAAMNGRLDYDCRLQEGPISDREFEELVLRLHEIQVQPPLGCTAEGNLMHTLTNPWHRSS